MNEKVHHLEGTPLPNWAMEDKNVVEKTERKIDKP